MESGKLAKDDFAFDSHYAPANPVDRVSDTQIRLFADAYAKLNAEIQKAFVGQQELVLGSLVALFAGGHALVESVPGLGKTVFASALGRALGCQFGRIQFTPDLMPSDVVGAPVFSMKTQEFVFRPGPVFTQILLADEIIRFLEAGKLI